MQIRENISHEMEIRWHFLIKLRIFSHQLNHMPEETLVATSGGNSATFWSRFAILLFPQSTIPHFINSVIPQVRNFVTYLSPQT